MAAQSPFFCVKRRSSFPSILLRRWEATCIADLLSHVREADATTYIFNSCLKAQAAKPHATLWRTSSTEISKGMPHSSAIPMLHSLFVHMFMFIDRHTAHLDVFCSLHHQQFVQYNRSLSACSFFYQSRSKRSVQTQAPAIPVVMAVLVFIGTAALLIVNQFSMLTALITIPHNHCFCFPFCRRPNSHVTLSASPCSQRPRS